MKLVRRLTYFSAAFVLGTGAMLAFFHQMGLFEVNRIPVEVIGAGDDARERGVQAAEPQLRGRLEEAIKKFGGRRIWEIDLGEVKASVVRDEWVKDVLISRSFPNEILVRVRPKTPLLVLVSSHGVLSPVTEEGEILSALPADALPDVPLLRGEVFENDKGARERAVKFVLSLPNQGPFNRRNISDISWNADEGYAVTLIQPKIEVKLGEERVDLKVMRAAQVLTYLSTNHLKGRVIDASFSKKVLVRLRKGP